MDLKVSGNPEFIALWAETCRDYDSKEEKWIDSLRKAGVKAAHPDDGWVDREKNSVYFSYPQFDDGVEIGNIIALGWHDKWRLVEVIGKTKRMYMDKEDYLFRPNGNKE